ncbi:MAG: diguanylate cyclase, partial [Proteobacteria bacterium]|nr:diguanylate cyclase [Pseudomonadota bacterium]
GIAMYTENESVEALIKRADDALYHAKNTGRNKTVTESNIQI